MTLQLFYNQDQIIYASLENLQIFSEFTKHFYLICLILHLIVFILVKNCMPFVSCIACFVKTFLLKKNATKIPIFTFNFTFFIDLKVAKKIWNNLLEPVEAKAGWRSDNSYKLRCPSRSAPFISTLLNSQDDFDLVDDEVCYHILNIDMFNRYIFRQNKKIREAMYLWILLQQGHYDDHDDEDDDDEPFERVQLQRRKRKRRRKKRIRNKRSKSTIHLSHGYKGNECTLL